MRIEPDGAGRRWSQTIVVLVPLYAAAMVVGLLAGPFVPTAMAFVLMVPFVGYLVARVRLQPSRLPEGPCQNSGEFLGGTWFTFREEPLPRWTLDPAQAQTVRQRPPVPMVPEGMTLRLGQIAPGVTLDSSAGSANFAAAAAAALVLSAIGTLVVVPNAGLSWAAALLLGLWASSLTACLLGGFVYGLAIMALGSLLDLAWGMQLTPEIEVEGTVLRANGRTFYLTEDLTATLGHGLFGAQLTLLTRADRMVLRGEHALMHGLQSHIVALLTDRDVVEPDPEAQRLREAMNRRQTE